MTTLRIGEVAYPSLEGKVSDEEWRVRVNTAAIFRLIPMMGWDDLSMQLVSARVGDGYLFVPNGPLFEEVTASSLVKINIEGEVISDSPFGIVKSTWYPMKAVHEVREDANYVIHTHDDIIAAVACNSEGLLPISQSAAFAWADGLAYHAYDGVETYEEKMPGLQQSLGATNNAALLQNHGLLTLGVEAGHAFMRHYNIWKACRVQMMAQCARHGELIKFSQEMLNSFKHEVSRVQEGDGTTDPWAGLLRKLIKKDPSFMN
ncbi:class II aldolase/adducin family protein [Pseudomonas sp. C11]|uniref:class II aldolase/adducin family protein n=1 Tax=Pseudomonas sp. C11 TaxID=3075550 RepID=UPI002AFF02F2|nr:class II aldolase/adducin family protein [Pseudomonas sp. C11]